MKYLDAESIRNLGILQEVNSERLMGWLNYLKGVPFSTKNPWSKEDTPPTRWLPRPVEEQQ